MSMSRKCVETLLDLVEVKLSCIEIYDREDRREVKLLETCRDELLAMSGRGGRGRVIPMRASADELRAAS